MPLEIERKFLIHRDQLPPAPRSVSMIQGYLHTSGPQVRIRISGHIAKIAVKSETVGLTRSEYEYEIPVPEAHEMLKMAPYPPLQKTRHFYPLGKHTWEVDLYEGAHQGLAIAEIELESETETFEKPDWISEEVSENPDYSNVLLWLQHDHKKMAEREGIEPT